MTKRWGHNSGQYIEDPAVDAFIEDLIKLCKSHNLSIGHEDHHGAFMIEPLTETNLEWLSHAHKLEG
jgi:hypothetical protein